jgi:UDP-N-acetylglucosamine 2-epimerase (non-hydrolysing)
MDTLRFNHQRLTPPANLNLLSSAYLVFTLNRKALMADRDNLRQMLQALLDHAGGMPVIAPLREEAAEVVKALGLGYNTDLSTPLPSGGVGVGLIPPQSYLAFSHLLRHAHGIITDSGNVAEEATFYSVPCITLNSYTEHIETVKVGSNVLVGEDPVLLADAVDKMVSGTWKSSAIPDRWDGRTAERILQILLERR